MPSNYQYLGNRFKELDLILYELWIEVRDIVQKTGSKTILRNRNVKKQYGCLRGLTNSCEKKRSKKQRRKGKIHPFECRVPSNKKR